MLLASTVLTACGGDGSTSADATEPPATQAQDDAQDGGEDDGEAADGCGWRLVNPEDPVPGDLFARCTVQATATAGFAQYHVDNEDDSASGPLRMGEQLDMHLTSDTGIEIVALGDRGWLNPGTGWVAAEGSGDQAMMAQVVVSLYRALTAPAFQQDFLASSPEWVRADHLGAPAGAEGAVAYRGTPSLGDVALDPYVVWVRDDHLPVRVEATGSWGGYSGSTVQTFSDWGEPVTIEPPA
ncbi:hypothetical protein GCM10027194_33260 [Thalassiella azotivora]